MKGRLAVNERISGIGLRDAFWTVPPLLFAALPLGWLLGFPAVLFFAGCVLLHLRSMWIGTVLPSAAQRAVLATGLVGVAAIYRSLWGPQAGVAVFLVLCGTKLLEARTRREYGALCSLGYFMLLCGLFDTQQLLLCLYLGILFFWVTAALLRLHSSAPAGDGLYVASAPPLAPLLRTTLSMALQTVPIVVLLFFFFPRAPQGFGLQFFHRNLTGMGDSLEPGSVEKLVENGTLAFRVRFLEGNPGRHPYYWRGVVLWKCRGLEWEKGRGLPADEPRVDGPIRQEIILEPHGKRWLFALDQPISSPDGSKLQQGRYLLADRPVDFQQLYRVISGNIADRTTPPASALQPAKTDRAIPRRVRELAESWQGTPREKTMAAEKFFSRGFSYSLTSGAYSGDGWRMLEEFLFERKKGFCSHFAAAFASLLRLAVVPTRIVMGYQGGEFNPLGGFYSIYQTDAHAWCEVWLEEAGWVRIDPTALVTGAALPGDPARAVEAARESLLSNAAAELERFGFWKSVRYRWGTLNYQWSIWVLGYDREVQQDFLRRLNLDRLGILGVFSGSLAAIGLFLAGLALLLAWRGRPREDAPGRAYARLCRRLARAGFPRTASEPPTAYLERIVTARPEWKSTLEPVFAQYVLLRYAPWKTDDLRETLRAFQQAVRRVRV